MADKRLDRVTADQIQDHIDARTEAGRASMTIRNEVLLISAVYRHAASKPGAGKPTPATPWGLTSLVNPVAPCRLPVPPEGRQRRLEGGDGDGPGEQQRMRAALLAGRDGQTMEALMTLAIETGLRLSEILDLRASQVRRVRGARFVARPDSKSGRSRRVVLSTRAAAALDALIAASPEGDHPLIRLRLAAVEWRWKMARIAADVTGLTIHDLRHEGLSRMADLGLTIGELQAQSGHRTAQVLMRYINGKPVDVARKLG